MMFALLSLLACPGGGAKCDSSDSVCNTYTSGGGSCNGSPVITGWGGDCPGATCEWSVVSDQPMGNVELYLVQTGDPTGTCGASKGDVNSCGEWTEVHEAFTNAGSGDGACGETKSITLDVKDDYTLQSDNSSTLFDSSTEFNQLTVMFIIYDQNGNYADCGVAGDDPSYFASDCSNDLP